VRLEGKVAVLVGGEGPLGREVTRAFLAEGAKVVVGWYTSDDWKEAEGLIPHEYDGRFIDVYVDATKEEQVKSLVDKTVSAFGSVDILVHMVGIFHAGQMIWETDTAIFEKLIETNLKSAFLCAKHAVKSMLEKGRGRLLFFPGKLPFEPKPGFGANAVSKAGMYTLMLALREELKETHITVNAVMPSIIDTWKTRKIHPELEGRMVNPAEIARLISCICSDDYEALSGSILKVFGEL
jgi:NAD(P)-dependent dehydrogenase (short-subunit alcohol dehydrogenase family)